VTVTNESSDPMTIDSIQPGSQFKVLGGQSGDCAAGAAIAEDATCAVRVAFDPDVAGSHSQTVQVQAHTLAKTLSATFGTTGTGARSSLAVDQSSLDFGTREVADGPTAAKTVTVSNDGNVPMTLDAVTPGSRFRLLTGGAGDCAVGDELAVGQTCAARVLFDPDPAGTQSQALTVEGHSDLISKTVTTALAGTSLRSAFTVDRDSLAFGAQELAAGPTAPQTITVRNTGTGALQIDAVAAGSPFRVLTGAGGDCAAGASVAAGATCAVRVVFDPDGAGGQLQSVRIDARTETRSLSAAVDAAGFGFVAPAPAPGAPAKPAAPSAPAGATVRDTVRPRLSGLKVTRGRISFRLTEPARVVLGVQRCTKTNRRKRCTRWTLLNGRLGVDAKQGANSAKLPSRIGGKKLRPGRYRLIGAAIDAARNSSTLARGEFRLRG
jgi:hypothetical protein